MDVTTTVPRSPNAEIAGIVTAGAIEQWARDRLAEKNQLRTQLGPDRPEDKTWFDVLDLDERRPVAAAHP